jgi:hypothetical protein
MKRNSADDRGFFEVADGQKGGGGRTTKSMDETKITYLMR